MTVSARAATILSRFPRHLVLDAPGSLFGDVVDGLAGHLDRLLADLGRVRRAHRIGQCDELADLMALVALHGMRGDLFELARRRIDAVAGLAPRIAADAAALADLPDVLAQAPEAWVPLPGESDAQTRERMAAALAVLARNEESVERQRSVALGLVAVHRAGNGSPRALLQAAAHLLALEPGRLRRSGDDYWHVLDATDRLRADGSPTPRTDLLALEENPEKEIVLDPVARSHREPFTIQRLGFGPVPCDVRVVAKEDRCIWPMVVDVAAGHAVVYADRLNDGQELLFRASGIVELDGVEAGNLAFAIDGGVYADEAAAVPGIDFVFGDEADEAAFGDRVARFGVSTPAANALDGALPHGGGFTPPITLAVGTTRLRFFVREATFGSVAEGADVAAQPIYAAGFWDGALAADAAAAPAADIGFSWRERQPYCCTLWLPLRFSKLDSDDRIAVRERIRLALDRVRPAGVYLGVEYADDRWTLGDGVLRDEGSAEPEGLIVHGTRITLPEPA